MSNIHLQIAHPSKDSLNYAMKDAIYEILKDKHIITTSDVYDLWRQDHPTAQPYGTPRNKTDIKKVHAEQQKILCSDLTIIQFPLYWFSFPGLLKNYWDQVLEPGFAYPGKFKKSPLNNGRRILFSITTQSTENDFSDKGVNGTMESILNPLTVAFRFVGFNILKPFIAYNVTDKDKEANLRTIQVLQSSVLSAVTEPEIWLPV